jgi:glutamine amidotransferase
VCAAIGWIAEHLPVYSVNFVLTTATDLWALRYPAANELWLLPRRAGGTDGGGVLDARTDRIHVGSAALADRPSVVVASEPMDEDPAWRPLSSGELIHVDAELTVHCRLAFPDPPAHLLTLADLQPEKARSQTLVDDQDARQRGAVLR